MTRSPLAYPLSRSPDSEAGGAADLQTDIMRFMAILSLCLVAIFALVQSIPLTPVEAPPADAPAPRVTAEPPPQPVALAEPVAAKQPGAREAPAERQHVSPESLALTRPKWVPQHSATSSAPVAMPQPEPPKPEQADKPGFTLRFESDAALTRAVAARHVGVYALDGSRALRMTVSDSRISFWDASMPNTFHEMEAATVPAAVVDALQRTGTGNESVSWGVTLPGTMKSRLDELMNSHDGGSLIIGAGGDIRWESL